MCLEKYIVSGVKGYSKAYIDSNFYTKNYVDTNFVGVANPQTITGAKIFSALLGLTRGFTLDWVTAPTGTANKTTVYADASGRISWRNGTGFTRTFDGTGITANRSYVLPDGDTTLAGLSMVQTFSALNTFSAGIKISNTFKITNGLDSSQSVEFTGTLRFNDASRQDHAIGGSVIQNLTSGGLAIGKGTTTIDSKAILELSSTTRGFLLPRMTAAQRGAIAAPVDGLMVYQTDGDETTRGVWVYSTGGARWMRLSWG